LDLLPDHCPLWLVPPSVLGVDRDAEAGTRAPHLSPVLRWPQFINAGAPGRLADARLRVANTGPPSTRCY